MRILPARDYGEQRAPRIPPCIEVHLKKMNPSSSSSTTMLVALLISVASTTVTTTNWIYGSVLSRSDACSTPLFEVDVAHTAELNTPFQQNGFGYSCAFILITAEQAIVELLNQFTLNNAKPYFPILQRKGTSAAG